MLKFFIKGFSPFDDEDFLKPKKKPVVERYDDELVITSKDLLAMYIAAMQVFLPVLIGFGLAYFVAIYFLTEIWIK